MVAVNKHILQNTVRSTTNFETI